jgi:TRAP-type C4-dicarboxylate transport system permease small subunit
MERGKVTVFAKIDSALNRFESLLLLVIILFMVGLAFLQVILRSFFHSSIFWGDILLRQLVLWITLLGASLATRDGRHINIDVLSRLLSGVSRRVVLGIVNLFAAVVSAFLVYTSVILIVNEMALGTTLFGDFPTWPFQLILPVGFAVMTFRFILKAAAPLPEPPVEGE